MSRHLAHRFLLGTGPLKRTTDRLHVTAHAQAATRMQRTATLLSDAPAASGPDGGGVLTRAEWPGPHGRVMTGDVIAPNGDPTGSAVTIWVDRAGRITTEPLRAEDIAMQSSLLGFLAALALPALLLLLHLLVVWLLDRARSRRWAAEWATVEPLWAGRTR